MLVDEALRARRSIRSYQTREVPEDVVEEILDLTRHSPSAMNGQPWRFVVIRDPEIKSKLGEIKRDRCPDEKMAYAAGYLQYAPLVVAICVESSRSYDRLVENGVLAAGYLMLAATARGLGSVYLSAYRDQDPDLAREISALLELPDEILPIALIPLGFADEKPPPKKLRPLSRMVTYV